MISLFPDALCIRIQGISLTSKSSDISWVLLYWGYWMLVNYTFFLIKFDLHFTPWYVIPIDILLFLLAILSRVTDYLKVFTFLNILILFFPVDSVGIFREECSITIVRAALYFLSFYVIEFATKTSGMALLPYTCWILNVWKWFLPLLVVQFVYVFVTDYFKRDDNIFSRGLSPSSSSTTSTCVTSTNKTMSPPTIRPLSGGASASSPNRKNNNSVTPTKQATALSTKKSPAKPKVKGKHKHHRRDEEDEEDEEEDHRKVENNHHHNQGSINHYGWNTTDHFGVGGVGGGHDDDDVYENI
jgi:hypothetical protein